MAQSQRETQCPSCERADFESSLGVKFHHKKSHGESLSYDTTDCPNCSGEFEVKKSRIENQERVFCCQECYGEWISENVSGKSAPAWSGGKVELTCEFCGSEYKEKKSRVERSKFCSKKCMLKGNSGAPPSGENHFNWKGGWSEYYGKSWDGNKKKARHRDQHRCQRCGTTSKHLNREPDVHHIIPFHVFGVDNHETANKLKNLITLCPSCHQTIELKYNPVSNE